MTSIESSEGIQNFLNVVFKHIKSMTEYDNFIGRIIIFSKILCVDSMKSKMLLRNLDIPYIDVCLDKHPKVRT